MTSSMGSAACDAAYRSFHSDRRAPKKSRARQGQSRIEHDARVRQQTEQHADRGAPRGQRAQPRRGAGPRAMPGRRELPQPVDNNLLRQRQGEDDFAKAMTKLLTEGKLKDRNTQAAQAAEKVRDCYVIRNGLLLYLGDDSRIKGSR